MKHKMTVRSVAAAWALSVLAASVLEGCGSPRNTVTAEEAQAAAEEVQRRSAESTPSVNVECPIMSGPVDPERTIVYKNQKVAFCCGDCLVSWLGLTDEERDIALAEASRKR